MLRSLRIPKGVVRGFTLGLKKEGLVHDACNHVFSPLYHRWKVVGTTVELFDGNEFSADLLRPDVESQEELIRQGHKENFV